MDGGCPSADWGQGRRNGHSDDQGCSQGRTRHFCNFILSLERVVFLFNIDYIYFILSNDNFYDKDTQYDIRAHDCPI